MTNYDQAAQHEIVRAGRVATMRSVSLGPNIVAVSHSIAYVRRRFCGRSVSGKTVKVNEHGGGPFHRSLYRLRERMERLINRMKQNRRIATRYEKCADNYGAMRLIAATLLWL